MAADCGGQDTYANAPPGPSQKNMVVKKGKMALLTKRGKMTPFTLGTLELGDLHRHPAPRNPPPLSEIMHLRSPVSSQTEYVRGRGGGDTDTRRHPRSAELSLPRIRTEAGRRRLCYRGVSLLNELDIREAVPFKSTLRNVLLEKQRKET